MALESSLADIVHVILPQIGVTDVNAADGVSSWVSDEATVTIQPLGYARQGVDERRHAAEGDDLRERIYGVRTWRVQFTCETNRQTFEATALEMADDLIAGLTRTDVEDSLAALFLGVPVCSQPRQVNAPDAHGDQRSIAVFEAAFPASRRHTGGLITRIAEINVTADSPPTDITVGPVP